MGNALINELIIGTGDKDKFSMSEPEDDAQFGNYLLDPLLARVINAAYGGAVPIPSPPRLDLAPLVLYTNRALSGMLGAAIRPYRRFAASKHRNRSHAPGAPEALGSASRRLRRIS